MILSGSGALSLHCLTLQRINMQINAIDWNDAQQVAAFVSKMLSISESPHLHEQETLEVLRQLTPFQRNAIRAGFRQIDKWIEKADQADWPDEL